VPGARGPVSLRDGLGGRVLSDSRNVSDFSDTLRENSCKFLHAREFSGPHADVFLFVTRCDVMIVYSYHHRVRIVGSAYLLCCYSFTIGDPVGIGGQGLQQSDARVVVT